MNIPRLGLLLAVLLASSNAVGNDGHLVVDVQDEAIFDPASAQTQKKIDPDDSDAVLSSAATPSSQGTSSPSNLRHHVQPTHIDRRLDGHSSSFAGRFIDDLLHHHGHLRHAEPHRTAPDKQDDLTHHLLRGGLLPRMDDGTMEAIHGSSHMSTVVGETPSPDYNPDHHAPDNLRRLAVIGTSEVDKNSDNVNTPEVGSLRWALNKQNNGGGTGYRLIKFNCDHFADPTNADGNTIALNGDLIVTREKIVIDATTCSGGITIKAANWNIGDTPTAAAPIIHVQSSADGFIYRGMHHIRVPLIVNGFGAMFSHNHFEWYKEYTVDNDDAEAALVLRSPQNDVSQNEFSNNNDCLLVTGNANSGNKIFRNNMHSHFSSYPIGIKVASGAGATISQNRIMVSNKPITHTDVSPPGAPDLRYHGPGTTNPVPTPTCSQIDRSVTLTAVTSVLPENAEYTIEFFSSSSPGKVSEYYVGSLSGKLSGTETQTSHAVILPCITGSYVRATITSGGQTSELSIYANTSDGWANNCQCGSVVNDKCDVDIYDAYCPAQVSGSPGGLCIDVSSNSNHCGACGHSCPKMSDYQDSNSFIPSCSNGICSYDSITESSTESLVSFNFEVQADQNPGVSCEGSLFYAPNDEDIGYFFDKVSDGITFTFEEKPEPAGGEISTEVIVLGGTIPSDSASTIYTPDAPIYTGGTAIGGNHAIGMFSNDFNSKQDQTLIRFDAGDYAYLLIQLDMAAAALPESACLTTALPYVSGTQYEPVLHLVLADWQGEEPFDWDNLDARILDSAVVVGASVDGSKLDGLPYEIEWRRKSYYLHANGSTNGGLALIFYFEEGPSESGAFYGLVDNLVITGSSNGGFSPVELEDSTENNLAHIIVRAGVDGEVGYQLFTEDCATALSGDVTISFNGGTRAAADTVPSYEAGSEIRLDLHLEDSLFTYFNNNPGTTSRSVCLKLNLSDDFGTTIAQKTVKLVINLDVYGLKFVVGIAADNNVDELTLDKSMQAEVSLIDASGDPVPASYRYSSGETVRYTVTADTDIVANTFNSDLIAPAPVNTHSLVASGVKNGASTLSPDITITGTTAKGSIVLSPSFLSSFSQEIIPMKISGSLRRANSRRLASRGLLSNEQIFAISFDVEVPKKERLSATASGVLAAGLIILFCSIFAFVSYKQRPKSSISPDQKSVTSVKTCPTVSSAKTSRSYCSAPSAFTVNPNRDPSGGIKASNTALSTKSPNKSHWSSQRILTPHATKNSTAVAKACTASKGASCHHNSHRPARPARPLKSIPEIQFSPASVVALNAKMVSDRPKY